MSTTRFAKVRNGLTFKLFVITSLISHGDPFLLDGQPQIIPNFKQVEISTRDYFFVTVKKRPVGVTLLPVVS